MPRKKAPSRPSYTSGRGSGRSTASQRARGQAASRAANRSTTSYYPNAGLVARYNTSNNMDNPNRVVNVFRSPASLKTWRATESGLRRGPVRKTKPSR